MDTSTTYPGETLALPAGGPGSLASWGKRIAALVLDWALSMAIAVGIFGTAVLTQHGGSFAIMGVFFLQKTLLTIFAGGSFGQLLARVGLVRIDGQPVGWWRPLVRTALVCLVLPAVVVGAERRGLHDLVLGTVVVSRV